MRSVTEGGGLLTHPYDKKVVAGKYLARHLPTIKDLLTRWTLAKVCRIAEPENPVDGLSGRKSDASPFLTVAHLALIIHALPPRGFSQPPSFFYKLGKSSFLTVNFVLRVVCLNHGGWWDFPGLFPFVFVFSLLFLAGRPLGFL